MKNSVMISIRPKWCELIASGEKTIEVRKNRPRLATPFKCYIYCTANKDTHDLLEWHIDGKIKKMNSKVIGEFICNHIDYVRNYGDCVDWLDVEWSCLSAQEIIDYAKDKKGNFVYTFAWHISELQIYDEPKELNIFSLKRPPQSWCYVEEMEK